MTHEFLYYQPTPKIIAIDIPIGLPDIGSRICDSQARKLLGQKRASSVFPAPIRPVLAASDYREACAIGFDIERRKLSRQAWGILPRIRDIDEILRGSPELRSTVREVHPEVCFCYLNREQPLEYNKKTIEGQRERLALLEPVFGDSVQDALSDRHQLASAGDDVLDAFVALWTAERLAAGAYRTIPSEPPTDRFGLRMEMVV